MTMKNGKLKHDPLTRITRRTVQRVVTKQQGSVRRERYATFPGPSFKVTVDTQLELIIVAHSKREARSLAGNAAKNIDAFAQVQMNEYWPEGVMRHSRRLLPAKRPRVRFHEPQLRAVS